MLSLFVSLILYLPLAMTQIHRYNIWVCVISQSQIQYLWPRNGHIYIQCLRAEIYQKTGTTSFKKKKLVDNILIFFLLKNWILIFFRKEGGIDWIGNSSRSFPFHLIFVSKQVINNHSFHFFLSKPTFSSLLLWLKLRIHVC